MSLSAAFRRISRWGKRFLLIAVGRGLKTVQTLERQNFLALFDPLTIGGTFAPGEAGAQDVLLEHFRKRISKNWPVLPANLTDLRVDLSCLSEAEIVSRAEAALEHDLHPSGIKPRLREQGKIDWNANPAGTVEWRLMLHRHAWWSLWGRAYQLTGDEKYTRAFVSQIKDWIEQNRMPALKSEHDAAWRLMECGLRLRLSWIPAFGCFYHSSEFSGDAKLLVLRAIYDHCNFLHHFFTNRNHLVRESNGLLAAAIAFPEFSDSETWASQSIERLAREVEGQVNEDGSHIEMSVGYQWLAIDEFEVTRSLLRPTERSMPSVDLDATLEKMYTFLAFVMRPDTCFPQLNDGFILWDADRLLAAAQEEGRSDWEFAATNGESGQVPGQTSRYFPNAGIHVMRSGWDRDARYLVFDTGPYGGPHGHEDKLSFELFAYGTPFIVDPGSFTYQASDPYRNYFVGSQGHNTILVDGKSQVRRWGEAHMHPGTAAHSHGSWSTTEHFDCACGTYDDGYAEFALRKPKNGEIESDVVHVRQVVFAKPDYWLIVDDLSAAHEHSYSAFFHLSPEIEVISHDNGSRVVLQSMRTGAKLAVFAIGSDDLTSEEINGREAPIQGWYSADHHKKQPASTIVFTTQPCRSRTLMWLLIPLRAVDDIAGVNIEQSQATDSDGTEFQVSWMPGSSLSAGTDRLKISANNGETGASRIDIIRDNDRRWPE
jgi:hypothetical protein